MAATLRYNAEILLPVFMHAKKVTRPTKTPSNTRLFIFDETPMYTNILIGPSLQCIGRFAFYNKKHVTVPLTALMDTLRLLMNNNAF